MYDILAIVVGAKQAPGYVSIMVHAVAATMCTIEAARTYMMMRIMNKENVSPKEPIVYNLMLATFMLMLLLLARSILYMFRGVLPTAIFIYGWLSSVPIMLYVYTVRLASKLIWEDFICHKHGIDDRLIYRKRKNK